MEAVGHLNPDQITADLKCRGGLCADDSMQPREATRRRVLPGEADKASALPPIAAT
jgi:hypothetical protein